MAEELEDSQLGDPALLRAHAAYFRAIFDMAAVGLLLVDAQGHIVLANEAQAQLWGYTRDDLRDAPLQRFILPDDHFVDGDLLQDLLALRRSSYTIDKRCLRKDGVVWWGRFTVSLVRDVNGQPFHTLLVCEDITDRKRQEQIDRDERQLAKVLHDTAAVLNRTLRLEEVLDNILRLVQRVVPFDAAQIMLLDESAQTMRVARARGYPQLDAMLTLQFPVQRPPHLHQVLTTRQPVVIGDTTAQPGWVKLPGLDWIRSYLAAPIVVQDEVIGQISVDSSIPDFYTAEHALGLQALAQQAGPAIENARLHSRLERYSEDLERHVAARTQELREAYEQLHHLNQLKDQFVSRLSHDLRVPLANVKLYVGLLKKGSPEKRDEYLHVLSQQTVRLEKILDDLTEMSHLDRGKTEFHFAKCDLNEVVSELQDKWVAIALARHLTLSLKLTPDLPPIMADSSLLQQATAHLLKNAFDYSAPESHIACQTGFCQQEARSWVTLSITNSGLGLTSEELLHVGERFYRGGAARHYKIDGTGLGLALCREIVTRHGGRLIASSEPGVTTTFSIWLEPATTLQLEANAPVD